MLLLGSASMLPFKYRVAMHLPRKLWECKHPLATLPRLTLRPMTGEILRVEPLRTMNWDYVLLLGEASLVETIFYTMSIEMGMRDAQAYWKFESGLEVMKKLQGFVYSLVPGIQGPTVPSCITRCMPGPSCAIKVPRPWGTKVCGSLCGLFPGLTLP